MLGMENDCLYGQPAVLPHCMEGSCSLVRSPHQIIIQQFRGSPRFEAARYRYVLSESENYGKLKCNVVAHIFFLTVICTAM